MMREVRKGGLSLVNLIPEHNSINPNVRIFIQIFVSIQLRAGVINLVALIVIAIKAINRVMKMKTLIAGVFAVLVGATAEAAPSQAQYWVGFEGTEDGFLLNKETGEIWMTGICLRRIADLEGQGTRWVSANDTVEMIGRTPVRLRQTFRFDLTDTPRLEVDNPDRGGVQSFQLVKRPCPASAVCQVVMAQPVCAD